MKAKISVIIPAHNSSNFINIPLRSLYEQDFKDFEVVVIENGSQDDTYDIAKKLISEYSLNGKVISVKDADVSLARNVGIENTKAEYIMFLDSDDYLHPNALKDLYEKVTSSKSDVVFGGFLRKYSNGAEIPYRKFHKYVRKEIEGIKAAKWFLIGKIWLCMGNFIVKRGVIEDNSIRFRIGDRFIEDVEFVLRMLVNSTSISSVNREVMTYNIRAGSLSSGYEPFLLAEKMKSLALDESFDKAIRNILIHHKIPYLIVKDLMNICKTGNIKPPRWVTDYLKSTKIYLSKFGIYTYILSKIFLMNEKLFCSIVKHTFRNI